MSTRVPEWLYPACIVDVRLVNDLIGFACGENRFGQSMAELWEFQFACWVEQDVVVPRQPTEE